jgi:hypothetical protein
MCDAEQRRPQSEANGRLHLFDPQRHPLPCIGRAEFDIALPLYNEKNPHQLFARERSSKNARAICAAPELVDCRAVDMPTPARSNHSSLRLSTEAVDKFWKRPS